MQAKLSVYGTVDPPGGLLADDDTLDATILSLADSFDGADLDVHPDRVEAEEARSIIGPEGRTWVVCDLVIVGWPPGIARPEMLGIARAVAREAARVLREDRMGVLNAVSNGREYRTSLRMPNGREVDDEHERFRFGDRP